MDKNDRTKEELLAELRGLEIENQRLKAFYEKEISEFRLEKELVEKKMLSFEAVCESSPVPMLIIDETTNIVMANLAAVKLCDTDEEEILKHRPGNALRCIHSSKDPRGCGYAADCKICTLRNALELLIKKGGSINGADVEMSLLRNGKLQKLWMNVGVEPMMLGGVKHWCVALNDISKHKLAAESLFESEARFREVLENSIDASYNRNLRTNKYDYLSPVFCQIAGYSEEELGTLTAEVVWKQVHPDDLPVMNRFILNAISDPENKSYQLEYRFKHKETGEYRWLNDKFTVMRDSQGESIALIGSVGDITARKASEAELDNYKMNLEKLIAERTESLQHEIELRIQTEEALRESENKYRNIVDYSNSIILEWDIDGNIVFLNKYGLDFFGFEMDEILGKNVLGTIVAPKDTSGVDLESLMKIVQKNPNNFQISENENIRKNGEKVWIAWTNKGVSDTEGRLLKTLSVGFDRTRQHEMEKALQNYRDHLEKMVNERTQELTAINHELVKTKEKIEESESRLKLATASGQLGIWDWDVKNNVMIWDERMYELYGITKDAFLNNIDVWINGLHPEDKQMAIDASNAALAGGKEFDIAFRVLHPDGNVLYLKGNGIVIRDEEGNPLRMIGINKDITESKRAEEQLLQAKERAEESDRLKTAFLNNISHEIRTPLNGILGFASYIIQPNINQREKEEYMSELTHSSYRLINTVTDFMDMSLIVSGNMHPNISSIDVYSLIQLLHHRFLHDCEEKKLELKIVHCSLPSGTILKSDEELLTKALSHLMINAIKFTPNGSVSLGYEMKKNELEFFVADTGVGISEEHQERIFEVFMQENISNTRGHEGSGLGLSIASGIVKLLGGKIRLESKKMIGTTVFMTFPVENRVVKTKQEAMIEGRSVKKISLVLIAEDDEVSYRLTEVIMKKISGKIIRAVDGKEAVDLCLKHPEIDLVLMDVKMPIMDGYEAIRQIRKFNKEVIIIAQTAYGLTGDMNKSMEAGCDDYISKPIRKDELVAMIQKRIKP